MKKYKYNLLISSILMIIVSITLFYMYDNFVFQTYNEVVYYDYLLSGNSKDITVSNVEIYCTKNTFLLGNGNIIVKNNIVNYNDIDAKLVLNNNQKKAEYSIDLKKINDNDLEFSVELVTDDDIKKYPHVVTDAKLIIRTVNNDNYEVNLDIQPLQQLDGIDKEYKIENASIGDKLMRLGSLKTIDKKILKEYPMVSLEYRYLKDNNLSKDNDDNYIVFKKISGKSIDLVNKDNYGAFYLEKGSFKDKELSVVVIFSNDVNKFAFAIDLMTK